jgi:transposase-like protein
MEDVTVARTAKAGAPAVSSTRKRLTPAQKAEIVQSLGRGEAGNAIAQRLGVSAATVYAYRRKSGPAGGGESPRQMESELRKRLVNFAVRSLLGQTITQDERDQLEREVREELVKRIAAGL